MADIATANITRLATATWGNKRCEIIQVAGDSTGVTVQSRLGRIEAAFVGNQTAGAGYNPQLSWSGHTVTYATAPLSGATHTLFVVGID